MSLGGELSLPCRDGNNTTVQTIRPNSVSAQAEQAVQGAVAVNNFDECREQFGGFGEEVEGGMSSSDETEAPEHGGEGREHDEPKDNEEARQSPEHEPAQ